MIRNDEDFWVAVEKQDEPLNYEDRAAVLAMMTSKPFLKLTKRLLEQTDEMKNKFLLFNLGDEKERAAASKLQGEIAAYPRLFGLMVEEALLKEEPNDETGSPENSSPQA